MGIKIKSNKAFFSNVSKNLENSLGDLIENTVQDISTEAAQRVPVDTGILRSAIDHEVKGFTGVVKVNSKYAAFIEFGTGTLYDAPAEWEQYASEFKGLKSGSFQDFKKNLIAWMSRKGIDQKYLFPIMMKILRVGIAPRPFLYPAFKNNTTKMLKTLEKLNLNGNK